MIETIIIVIPLMLSPGPANLVSFVLGARTHFYQLLPFQFGIIIVYGIIAFVLGSLTLQIYTISPTGTKIVQILGGLFIVYLGLQLLFRKNRETKQKAPTFMNGVLLQVLNPKYPGVILAVFTYRPDQPTWITSLVLTSIGALGLLIYSKVGSLLHTRTISGLGFRSLDQVTGSLLCLVGMWFAIQPFIR